MNTELKTNKILEVKSEAKWKTQFQIMWNNTPKKLRKNISQINNIRSSAKLYAVLWM